MAALASAEPDLDIYDGILRLIAEYVFSNGISRCVLYKNAHRVCVL